MRFSLIPMLALLLCTGCSTNRERHVTTEVQVATASSDATITKVDALELPVSELAERVMGSLAKIVNEVARPTFIGLPGGDVSLQYLSFATKPVSSDYAGLCEAEVISIGFSKVGRERRLGAKDTLVTPTSITTRSVFKVAGSTQYRRMRDWSDAYIQELKTGCSIAGRVLPTETGDFGQARYFEISGTGKRSASNNAWIAASVLQRALEISRSGASPVPVCDSSACSNAAAVMRDLSLSSLIVARVEPCHESTLICVEGEFPESELKPTWHWVVRAEVEIREMVDDSESIGPIHKIEVAYKPPVVY